MVSDDFYCETCRRSMSRAEYYAHPCPPVQAANAPLPVPMAETRAEIVGDAAERNGAGIERAKLHASPGRPKGARNLNAKHPSSISRAFLKAGLNWQTDFALAIKGNNRARIKLWLRLLPYLVTTTNRVKVKKWKGKASRAALVALEALEGKPHGKDNGKH